MSKLLRSSFMRMKRLEIFWIVSVFCFGIYLFVQYMGMTVAGTVEGYTFAVIILMGLFTPVFCSLFVGMEYSDGTVCNKIVVGHTRSHIYASNFLATVMVVLGCFFLLAGITVILGVFELGGIEMPMGQFLLICLDAVLLCIEYAAIYTMISMLCSNKTYAAIFSILLAFGLLFFGAWLCMKLETPEWIEEAMFTVEGTVRTRMTKNPKYVEEGIERSIYQFLLDFTPGGQQMQLADASAQNPILLGAYSLVLTLITNIAGIFFFKRKDIK